MRIKYAHCIIPVLVFLLLPTSAKAQFQEGGNYLGPSIGLSFLGSSPEFGLNYERGVNLKDIGTVGFGGIFRYWHYSESFYGGEWGYTNILIGAQGNYHFVLNDSKFDPWLGLILAYVSGSVSWSGSGIQGSYSIIRRFLVCATRRNSLLDFSNFGSYGSNRIGNT